jgi:hypothetical protein
MKNIMPIWRPRSRSISTVAVNPCDWIIDASEMLRLRGHQMSMTVLLLIHHQTQRQ